MKRAFGEVVINLRTSIDQQASVDRSTLSSRGISAPTHSTVDLSLIPDGMNRLDDKIEFLQNSMSKLVVRQWRV